MKVDCFECETSISADTLTDLGDQFLAHARAEHEWPHPDPAVRNYAEATQRLTGPSDHLDEIGPISVEEVTADRLDDWLAFFDHDAFVGTPEWAACYCLEPHARDPEAPGDDVASWRDNRAEMTALLESGGSFGYLAYVNDRPVGWVNASERQKYSLYRNVDPDGPDPGDVIGVSCFIVAPPYRRHNVASLLLDRVIEDAADRGATWIEGYPFTDESDSDSGNFRGPVSMYVARGFEGIEVRDRDTVMRRPVQM